MESIVQDNAEDMLMFTFTLLVQPGIAFSCKAALAIPRLTFTMYMIRLVYYCMTTASIYKKTNNNNYWCIYKST